MKNMLQVVSGGGFDAGVIPPGPLQPGIDAGNTKQLPDGFMAAMSELLFEPELLSESDRYELRLLVAQRHLANQRAMELLDRFQERTREKLREQHEAAKAAVVAQQEKIEAHRAAISELTLELNRRNSRRASAVALRDEAQEEKRRMSRFVPARETERVNLLIVRREAECSKATEEYAQLQATINHKNLVEMKPLVECLNELVAKEAELNHYVTGQSFTNTYGIVVPARSPL